MHVEDFVPFKKLFQHSSLVCIGYVNPENGHPFGSLMIYRNHLKKFVAKLFGQPRLAAKDLDANCF